MVKDIQIENKGLKLYGRIGIPDGPIAAWVIFAHGSGSSHRSPRNNWVAEQLNRLGFGTLLFDLLSEKEDEAYRNRFNITLLGERLATSTEWLLRHHHYQESTPIFYFGASTGAAAALVAASMAKAHWHLCGVVSRGGRPDLAGEVLSKVNVPTLLIVGELDFEVIKLNVWAQDQLSEATLNLIPNATHLFEEPGTLEKVVALTGNWIKAHLPRGIQDELRGSLT